jgi:protein-S-isoprenylcysteine O-methyltransferase Ste14
LAWLLAVPFVVFATPTSSSILLGSAVAVVGLVIRGWAAGTIEKGTALATLGPYAYTRNPLYLGSFLVGIGLALAGGDWIWLLVFAAFFLAVYVPTVRQEARELRELFGERYRAYAASVPAFTPRVTPYSGGPDQRAGFSWGRYLHHREWEAALGVLALVGVLALKVVLSP